MKNKTEKALRRYSREIRSLLIVRNKESRRFMAEFTSSARDYLEANPGADFEAVRSHFGSEDYKNASPLMRETFKKVLAQDLFAGDFGDPDTLTDFDFTKIHMDTSLVINA